MRSRRRRSRQKSRNSRSLKRSRRYRGERKLEKENREEKGDQKQRETELILMYRCLLRNNPNIGDSYIIANQIFKSLAPFKDFTKVQNPDSASSPATDMYNYVSKALATLEPEEINTLITNFHRKTQEIKENLQKIYTEDFERLYRGMIQPHPGVKFQFYFLCAIVLLGITVRLEEEYPIGDDIMKLVKSFFQSKWTSTMRTRQTRALEFCWMLLGLCYTVHTVKPCNKAAQCIAEHFFPEFEEGEETIITDRTEVEYTMATPNQSRQYNQLTTNQPEHQRARFVSPKMIWPNLLNSPAPVRQLDFSTEDSRSVIEYLMANVDSVISKFLQKFPSVSSDSQLL
jgi:hypothetical protein